MNELWKPGREIKERPGFKRMNYAETPFPRKKTSNNKGGPKFDEVWDYFIKGKEVNVEHYKATCHYCKKKWTRRKPAILKAHLANECLPSIQTPLMQTKITQHFNSNAPLSSKVNDRID
ncbi:hypothetical protein GLOIN_2v1791622 [Rhizophagus irregularis DAOM 181602=DAOM 197198]|uniref:BED-type domain-containing protein n=1 Tax=Rhizophagus irregularis (strain DAOM 181602 / DAOM 197198 / MUCL 43194) TaxID=747089 RepID=A0A2P4NWQ3_RHIID|nr:hypothetical protein GLOIN_2v1791622 [Rhizophagus irregularis DAOM 181602=DAOM 197198]POG57585.1 hypothetical protein GLOIN_2v1791622 [Rhizophagus irregularis DAOM 181602=DAOM 197198]|eukprot:XP_025164451.1 hypothetical protein GLOIN_2v1791622 [Rhizophagus irregularis DAOM 181602=DAOM 197198]